ncbi:hypothetical protein [Actinopolyspora saharensis]|uniref:Uncharacterized protein n=1 Tax=Actinopolyspora saharensis TaxID=995062 RepID=A0A1H1A6L3_9ACTN|nr:hypothetical protein [Actinopolyspora saharensis]SDQ35302.1 hypothetical protein SAMN04489718_1439 [Actinopolyspora saharensis]
MSTPWTLHGSTRRDHDEWKHLHELTHGWTAAWADNHGFHLDAVPAEPPATTHLWAWTTGRWLRARIDAPHWWAVVLAVGDTTIEPSWRREVTDLPEVSPVLHWAATDGRIRQYRGADGVLDQDTHIQLVPHRRTTAPFIGTRDSLPGEFGQLLGST